MKPGIFSFAEVGLKIKFSEIMPFKNIGWNMYWGKQDTLYRIFFE